VDQPTNISGTEKWLTPFPWGVGLGSPREASREAEVVLRWDKRRLRGRRLGAHPPAPAGLSSDSHRQEAGGLKVAAPPLFFTGAFLFRRGCSRFWQHLLGNSALSAHSRGLSEGQRSALST